MRIELPRVCHRVRFVPGLLALFHCAAPVDLGSRRFLARAVALFRSSPGMVKVPVIPIRKIRALLFHGLCRLGKIDWASESHQELDRCLSRTITASKNFND